MLSIVLITPTNLRDKANALAEALGYGPNNYTVPLSEDGTEPATHYGLHTWAQETFADMLTGAGEGIMPDALIEAGYPPADFAAVVGSLIASVRGDMAGHFDEVTDGVGLVVVEREAP